MIPQNNFGEGPALSTSVIFIGLAQPPIVTSQTFDGLSVHVHFTPPKALSGADVYKYHAQVFMAGVVPVSSEIVVTYEARDMSIPLLANIDYARFAAQQQFSLSLWSVSSVTGKSSVVTIPCNMTIKTGNRRSQNVPDAASDPLILNVTNHDVTEGQQLVINLLPQVFCSSCTVTLTAPKLPPFATLSKVDTEAWQIVVQPPSDVVQRPNTVATFSTVVSVTDGQSTVTAEFNITVHDYNQLPTLSLAGNSSILEGQTSLVPLVFADADNDTVTVIKIDFLPSWASFSIDTNVITCKPTYMEVAHPKSAQQYSIVVYFSDREDTIVQPIILTVVDVNRLPVVTSYTLEATAGMVPSPLFLPLPLPLFSIFLTQLLQVL